MAGMTPAQAEDEAGGIIAEINITPLTDVFLVLLIIFMVTSSVIANTGKKVALPEAVAAQATPPKAVNVTVSREGRFDLNGEPVARDALQERLRALLEVAEEKLVVLRGDRTMVYGEAVYVLDQAQLAGAEGFALATTKKRAGARAN